MIKESLKKFFTAKNRYKKSPSAISLIELAVVIIIIGILVSGVIVANNLIKKSRLAMAESLSRSSPIIATQDNVLWLETSLAGSIKDSESSDGNALTAWSDQSTSVNKLSVVAVGSGPTYANTINSIHAVEFAGNSSDYLEISDASILNNTDYTIFVLEKRSEVASGSSNYFIGENPNGTANQSLALGYGADDFSVIHSQGSGTSYASFVNTYSKSSGKARMFTFVHSATTGNKTYINGVLASEDATKTNHLSGITSLPIGKNYKGEIGEIAIFTRALKSDEARSIEDYFAKKWSRKNNRDSVSSSSACVGYTITEDGCDTSASSCSINIAGLITTVPATTSSTAASCNQTDYSGSVSFTCVAGTASISGSCTQSLSCSETPAGVASAITASHGAIGSATCNVAGYTGNATYSCNNGVASFTSSCGCDSSNGYGSSGGSCVAGCSVPSGNGVSATWVAQGSASLSCDSSGYIDDLAYTCGSGNSFTINTACTRICSGGVVDLSVSGYVIHAFTSVSTSSFSCPTSKTVSVLVVAGGGAGGTGASTAGSGGGGGGGVIENNSVSVSASTPVTVTVGAGGIGAAVVNGGNWGAPGQNGGNSVFGSLTAIGGGGGGGREYNGNSGGSGGGGGISGGGRSGGSGTSGQGYAGGNSSTSGNAYGAGGGGGAGGAGSNGSGAGGGNGGIGIVSSITGASIYYGGGGGGSYHDGSGLTYGIGGDGGGGTPPAGSGVNGTGGGGGGAQISGGVPNVTPGGNGGSGIVIVRYAR